MLLALSLSLTLIHSLTLFPLSVYLFITNIKFFETNFQFETKYFRFEMSKQSANWIGILYL